MLKGIKNANVGLLSAAAAPRCVSEDKCRIEAPNSSREGARAREGVREEEGGRRGRRALIQLFSVATHRKIH